MGRTSTKKMLLLMLLRILWKHADEEHIRLSGPIDYRKVRDYHGEP